MNSSGTTSCIGDLFVLAKGRKATDVYRFPFHGAKKYIQIEDLRSGEYSKYVNDPIGIVVEPTDICIAWDGANAGTVAYGLEGVIGSTITRLRPKNKKIFTPYVGNFLQSKFSLLNGNTTGAAIPHLNKNLLMSLELLLPCFSEQKRITEIIDKAKKILSLRRQVIKLAEKCLRSIFIDMFGSLVVNSRNWPTVLFDEICDARLGKMLDSKQQYGLDKRKYLRNANVLWDRFDLAEVLEMDFDESDRNIFRLQYGDVLVCEGGEPGRAAIWREQIPECYFQKALHRIRPYPNIATSEFILHMLWQFDRNGGFKDHISSATIAHLTGAKLKSMEIPLPPIELQRYFSSIYQKVGLLKTSLESSLRDTELLFKSVSQRAFRGEL